MVSDHLQDIDEVLAVLSGIQMRLGGVEAELATCSFGSWEGQTARAAREERQKIVVDMNNAYDILATAERHFEDYRSELIVSATAGS